MPGTLDTVAANARELLLRDANIDRLAGDLLALCAGAAGHAALFFLAGDRLVGWRSCSGEKVTDISSRQMPAQSSALYKKLFGELRPVLCAAPELAASSGGRQEIDALTGGLPFACLAPLVVAGRPAGLLLLGAESPFSSEDASALRETAELFAARVAEIHEAEARPASTSAPAPLRETPAPLREQGRLDEEKIRGVLLKIDNLPAMPNIAGKVLEMVEGDYTSADDLQRIISNDPALTARILKVANSSYYCCGMDVNTLSEAVVILGFNMLRSLVVAASVRSLYVQKPVRRHGSGTGTGRLTMRQKTLWEHSVACAAVSRTIAKKTGFEKPEAAFIAGLLHDIGRLVICRQMPDEYERWLSGKTALLEGAGDAFPQRLILDSERDVFSFDHCRVGAAVAGKWRLSRDLVEVIAGHHDEENPPASQLAAVVAFSNIVCMKNRIGTLALPGADLCAHRDRLHLPLSDGDLAAVLSDLARILAAEAVIL